MILFYSRRTGIIMYLVDVLFSSDGWDIDDLLTLNVI